MEMDTRRAVFLGTVAVLLISSIVLMCVLIQADPDQPTKSTHPLILVSLDGFRADYLDRHITPTLQSIGNRGVKANYMKPSYPTLTFPNHYTIVTGLYPAAHGIIANSFYDPVYKEKFSMGTKDGKWWGGEPIWNTVTSQGKISATYFWPGSDANIGGIHPSYWYPYNGSIPYTDRVDKVIEWLTIPDPTKRPDLITLYFDHTGHGINLTHLSLQVNETVKIVDNMIKRLMKGLDDNYLTQDVNIIILADHGMAPAGQTRLIELNELVPNIHNRSFTYTGAFSRIEPTIKTKDEKMDILGSLACKRPQLRAYGKTELPVRFHFGDNRRIETIVLDLDDGWTTAIKSNWSLKGQHGYDNYYKKMNALFLATGPDFKEKTEITSFQNIELYNLMCHLVGVTPAPNNGTLGSLYHILAKPPPYPFVPPEKRPSTAVYPEDVNSKLNISGCPNDFKTPPKWFDALKISNTERNKLETFHLPWGIPQTGQLPAKILLLHHKDHVTGYSTALKMPLWTSYTLDNVPQGTIISKWTSDVRLNVATSPTCLSYDHLNDTNYKMTPLFPPQLSSNASLPGVPYLVSNAVPVKLPVPRDWLKLIRAKVPDWLAKRGPINFLSGPVFDDNADGFPDNFTEFTSPPSIPTHIFLIITQCKTRPSFDGCPQDDLRAISFIFPEVQSVNNCLNGTNYLLEFSAKVKDVELVTGLRFYPNLEFSNRISLVLKMIVDLWQ
ncbi:venom phosphodiesterase-like [Homarus americanus]|uniref:venom phosphodiesterase-like n=1 Tax=Homarus americanus TaxID=6706 RepID=UPI001C4669CF|nr:venom phosphodiesterase-like [Homarus americanus]